ncbi:hypothetical protein EXIGLDRAFT_762926 [Exidia glandulosa HHB12029]|uniref:F-box domain-containing protein n=1 Tax=Exidia glandulosa HHB12029 TaxID=1314781 RepID=A0A165MEL7_EXIGL|nr:hypothetical protein EXIGLDRAFT_762926 [Exidia glandulosa HHB12029]
MGITLNHDVLEQIVAHVDRSSLPAVCLVSRTLEHTGRRYLYENISVRAERAFVLFYTFIYARPQVGQLVRSYSELSSLNHVLIPAWSAERFRMLAQALARMNNLRTVRLRTPVRDVFTAGRGDDFSAALSGMPDLTSLMLHFVPSACGSLFVDLRASLTSIAVQGLVNEADGLPAGLAQLLQACKQSLTVLRLSTMDISMVLILHQDDSVWPNVDLLDISFCTADARLARAFPALRILIARDSVVPVAALLCAPDTWPHLQSLNLSHDFDVLEDAELPTPRTLDTFRVFEGRDAMFAGPHYEHLQDVLSIVACEALRHLTVCAMPWKTRDAQRLAVMCSKLESLSIHCDGVHAVSNLFDGLLGLRMLRRFDIIYRHLQRNLTFDQEGIAMDILYLGRTIPTIREARLKSWAGDPLHSVHWRWHRDEVFEHWTFETLPYEYTDEEFWLD